MTRPLWGGSRRLRWGAGVSGLTLVLSLAIGLGFSATQAAAAPAISSGDGPAGFWNGTDSDLPIHLEAVDVAPQDELGQIGRAHV